MSLIASANMALDLGKDCLKAERKRLMSSLIVQFVHLLGRHGQQARQCHHFLAVFENLLDFDDSVVVQLVSFLLREPQL